MTEDQIKKLKKHIKDEGLTQEKLADMFGVSQANISALLSGRTPFGKGVATAWEDKLGVRAAWLMIGDGEMLKAGTERPARPVQLEMDFSKMVDACQKTANAVVDIANANKTLIETNSKLQNDNSMVLKLLVEAMSRVEQKIDKGGNVLDALQTTTGATQNQAAKA